jgi:hypothetical protein
LKPPTALFVAESVMMTTQIEAEKAGDVPRRKGAKAKIERKSEPRPAGLKVPTTEKGQRDLFLRILRETANVSRAARAAGLTSSKVYRWRERLVNFRADWNDALNEALDNLEEVLRDRAINGVEKPHYHGGTLSGTYKTYSNELGMFILRARRPDVYGKAALEAPSFEPADSATIVNKQLDIIAARVKARALSGGIT